jgi:hypothetical protein
LEHCWNLRFRFKHVTELIEAFIRNWNNSLVGVNGAEGIVLGRDVEIRQYIVGGRFSNVGQTDNTHSESVPGSSPKNLMSFLLLFLFWWHVDIKYLIIVFIMIKNLDKELITLAVYFESWKIKNT